MGFRCHISRRQRCVSNIQCDNHRMSNVRTRYFSLLLLAMVVVQLLMSPVAAYATMSARGSLLLDVCTAAPPVQGIAGGTQPGDQGLSLDTHHCQCLLCAELPPLSSPPPALSVLSAEPQGYLQVGNTWHQPGALAHKPPSTGPPFSA